MGSYKLLFTLTFIGYVTCFENPNFSLPYVAIPLHYNLTVNINFDQSYFLGNSSVILKTLENTKNLTLHSKNLNISKIELFDSGNLINTEYYFNTEEDFLVIKFPQTLLSGRTYLLKIDYIANLTRDENIGLYGGKFYAENYTSYFAATNLFPNYARRVFPCFDEPRYKSTYQLTLIRENIYNTVSNMEAVQRK